MIFALLLLAFGIPMLPRAVAQNNLCVRVDTSQIPKAAQTDLAKPDLRSGLQGVADDYAVYLEAGLKISYSCDTYPQAVLTVRPPTTIQAEFRPQKSTSPVLINHPFSQIDFGAWERGTSPKNRDLLLSQLAAAAITLLRSYDVKRSLAQSSLNQRIVSLYNHPLRLTSRGRLYRVREWKTMPSALLRANLGLTLTGETAPREFEVKHCGPGGLEGRMDSEPELAPETAQEIGKVEVVGICRECKDEEALLYWLRQSCQPQTPSPARISRSSSEGPTVHEKRPTKK